jgi:hypothetical protein
MDNGRVREERPDRKSRTAELNLPGDSIAEAWPVGNITHFEPPTLDWEKALLLLSYYFSGLRMARA